MSAITVGGDLVHYEVLGRGRPVILVHGWLGAWRYWIPTMQQLSLKYRVYALDLFGFGDSGKNPDKYVVIQQVKMLGEFMKALGVPKAAMIGHGLGTMILSEFAKDNPDKVARLLLASAPLFDPGDLDTRTPAGQLRPLTGNQVSGTQVPLQPPPLNLSALPVAPAAPAVTTPANPPPTPEAKPVPAMASSNNTRNDNAHEMEIDKTIPSRTQVPTVVARPTELTTPPSADPASEPDADPSHFRPTVQRVTSDDRARLMAAAQAAGIAGAAAPLPSIAEPEDKNSSMRIGGILFSDDNPMHKTFTEFEPETLLARCFKSSEPEFEKLKGDVVKADPLALKSSIRTFDSGQMLDMLRLLPMPMVLVHGVDDPIIEVPKESVWNYLTIDKEDTLLPIPLPGVRHFPMLEHTEFVRLVNQFLELPDISKIEMKERWIRRNR